MEKYFFFRFVPVEPFLYDFPFALTLAYISDLTPDPSVAFFLLPWHLSFCSFDRTYIWDCVGWCAFLTSLVNLKEMQPNTFTVQSQFKCIVFFA